MIRYMIVQTARKGQHGRHRDEYGYNLTCGRAAGVGYLSYEAAQKAAVARIAVDSKKNSSYM